MREELENQLREKYPPILNAEESRFYGFECGEGWYDIIDTMCGLIQHKIDWNNAEGKFHHHKPLNPRIPQVVAAQVKEKFGSLRFYYSGGNNEVRGIVEMAEEMSRKTCEVCGNKGSVRDFNWISTLCDEHARIREERTKEKAA